LKNFATVFKAKVKDILKYNWYNGIKELINEHLSLTVFSKCHLWSKCSIFFRRDDLLAEA